MRLINKWKSVVVLMSLIGLSGCAAGLDGDYACDKVGGVGGCTTMHDVRNNLDHYANPDNQQSGSSLKEAHALSSPFTVLPRRDRFGQPERTQEVTQKVTIFPFKDKSGSYVDTTDIYVVVEEPQWTGRPVQAVKGD
ncbi:type IV conjugative transfer system lipoprotein TraV [Vibrio lentus]